MRIQDADIASREQNIMAIVDRDELPMTKSIEGDHHSTEVAQVKSELRRALEEEVRSELRVELEAATKEELWQEMQLQLEEYTQQVREEAQILRTTMKQEVNVGLTMHHIVALSVVILQIEEELRNSDEVKAAAYEAFHETFAQELIIEQVGPR